MGSQARHRRAKGGSDNGSKQRRRRHSRRMGASTKQRPTRQLLCAPRAAGEGGFQRLDLLENAKNKMNPLGTQPPPADRRQRPIIHKHALARLPHLDMNRSLQICLDDFRSTLGAYETARKLQTYRPSSNNVAQRETKPLQRHHRTRTSLR